MPGRIWELFLFSGYLKVVNLKLDVGEHYTKLAISIEEVRIVYRSLFRNWIHKADPK